LVFLVAIFVYFFPIGFVKEKSGNPGLPGLTRSGPKFIFEQSSIFAEARGD
jgi:hypothetical protein